jgi:hypothetical protein
MKTDTPNEWPELLNRHASLTNSFEYQPRRVRKRFHLMNVTVWQGHVHVDDIEGYVENVRLRFYLNKWRARQSNPGIDPSSTEIYEMMIEADRDEESESRKPFHVERMAENIGRNGIQEPLIVFSGGGRTAELWDGNRRYYGTMHIMRDPALTRYRDTAQWLPVHLVSPSGDPELDMKIKHSILTECNFVEKDHIPWPAYVKAEEIHQRFTRRIAADPLDAAFSRKVKEDLAKEYGLKGWRLADRWIKMYDLALQFKEYEEEEHNRAAVDVDLRIQEKFEYFDELSKPGVWGSLKADPDARDEVFQWLWDGKFKAFPDVRLVPKILADPVARRQANAPDADAVKRAISTVIANDPTRVKDKDAANEKIKQFATWLDSFKREDFKQLNAETLDQLRGILTDVVNMLQGLLLNPATKAGAE